MAIGSADPSQWIAFFAKEAKRDASLTRPQAAYSADSTPLRSMRLLETKAEEISRGGHGGHGVAPIKVSEASSLCLLALARRCARQTPNAEPQTSNPEPQTSNGERRTVTMRREKARTVGTGVAEYGSEAA